MVLPALAVGVDLRKSERHMAGLSPSASFVDVYIKDRRKQNCLLFKSRALYNGGSDGIFQFTTLPFSTDLFHSTIRIFRIPKDYLFLRNKHLILDRSVAPDFYEDFTSKDVVYTKLMSMLRGSNLVGEIRE